MKILNIIAIALFANSAIAHELTPTYPKILPSYITGISVIKMKLWNRRNDANFYEIDVFDSEWNKISFASTDKIFQLDYLEQKNFDIYIKDSDKNKISFVCTSSKQLKRDVLSTGIKTRICSKIK